MLIGCSTLRNAWQWSIPFCAFFSTFSVVMTVLVLSTDLRGHHYMHFNNTNIWQFEDFFQDSPRLITLIRDNYLSSPSENMKVVPQTKPVFPSELTSLINNKTSGFFLECNVGNVGVSSDSVMLEENLGWRGLVTEPHPQDYRVLVDLHRPHTLTANVCISPVTNPIHATFRKSSLSREEPYNSSLLTVPCFPLYSLMLAVNRTFADLIVLNNLSAHLQVLRTIPFKRILVGVISIVMKEDRGDVCCDKQLIDLLVSKGLKQASKCPSVSARCYFTCSQEKHNCPP